MNDTKLLSIQDLVRETRLGRTSVFELIRTGRLRSIKIGKRRLVRANDLSTFIDGLAAKPIAMLLRGDNMGADDDAVFAPRRAGGLPAMGTSSNCFQAHTANLSRSMWPALELSN
ncbi:helix-turn-helix domain-containing protein [Mesorhizobium sp. AaZ16]|uniref:helix-turn-helix domain-containing protein n=1 Tax=Mesorhizobium sp. AaZ16 TaxID=3402289 RepID=UPI00374E97E1